MTKQSARESNRSLIGPTPHRNKELNSEVEHLASGFEDVADRRGVPFVDCFRPLVEHEGWNLEIETSDEWLAGSGRSRSYCLAGA